MNEKRALAPEVMVTSRYCGHRGPLVVETGLWGKGDGLLSMGLSPYLGTSLLKCHGGTKAIFADPDGRDVLFALGSLGAILVVVP